jgi:hypothetical protein
LQESKIGEAAFEVSQLLLDESNNSNEFTVENKTTNNSMVIFPDLQHIINQNLIPQKQFESFNQLFTTEGFLNFNVLISIRKTFFSIQKIAPI